MSTPPTCASCGRVSDTEELPPAPVLKRQAAGDNLEEDFHLTFESMVLELPPSEKVKLCAKFTKAGLDRTVDTPAAQDMVHKAYTLYQRRLERSRAGSAKRRLAAKAAKAEAAEAAVAETIEPVVAEQAPVTV